MYIYYLSSKNEHHVMKIKKANNLISIKEPHLWYPLARNLKRKFIYHYGPTNSGKTFKAISRLIESKSGIYCSPLRLLAWEIYDKVNDEFNKNNTNEKATKIIELLTGQECVKKENSTHISCTIEKTNFNKYFDVAVIDEIQMIGDNDRGDSWTSCVLGLQAKEIHLFGDSSCIDLIKRIISITGDELELIENSRRSTLKLEEFSVIKPNNSYFNIRKEEDNFERKLKVGDCIIVFSKKDLIYLRKRIEILFPNSTSIIYGNLPPEIKRQQTIFFNTEKTKFLLATDAIGMGMNLKIKRIIFYSIYKHDGLEKRLLTDSEILQISGRAGRNNIDGIVTSMYSDDYQYIKEIIPNSFKKIKKVEKACLFLTLELIQTITKDYSKLLEDENIRFYDILSYFEDLKFASLEENYFKKIDIKSKVLSEILKDVKGLSLKEEFYFCFSPFKNLNKNKSFIIELAQNLAEKKIVRIPENIKRNIYFCYNFHILDRNNKKNDINDIPNEIYSTEYFENLYNCLEIYIYVGNKLENNFIEIDEAFSLKRILTIIIENLIEKKVSKRI